MNKVKLTWRKVMTMLVETMLFGLMLQGNAAVNTNRNWLYYAMSAFIVTALVISVVATLLGDDTSDEQE